MKYKRNNYIYIVISCLILTTVLTVFMFFNKNYNKAAHKIVKFDDKNTESLYLQVSDVYGTENQETLAEMFAEKDSLKRMKEFSNIVNKEFDFLEFDKQSLVLRDEFSYKDEFRKDYGKSYFGEKDDIGISLQSVQIGKKTYEFYGLKEQIASGSSFKDDSFIFDNETIPAILGHEYSELVSVGDKIKFEYIFKEITIEVIGFLKKDTSIAINNKIYFLDRYIVIPLLEVNFEPKDEEDEYFQKILYSLKNWGYINVKDGEDYYDYKDKIYEISNKLDFKYIVNEGYVSQYITNVSNTMNLSKQVFLLASMFLFLFLSITYIYISIWNFNRNKKNYAIHLICGCSFIRLKSKIYFGIFIQFILSLGLSFIINRLLLGQDILYYSEQVLLENTASQTAMLSMVTMLGICLVLNIYFNKSNIYTSIQKED